MRSSLRLYCKQKRKFLYVAPLRAVEKVKDPMICRSPTNFKLFMSCLGLYPVEDENAADVNLATKSNNYIYKSKKHSKPKRRTKRVGISKGLKECKNRKGTDKSSKLSANKNLPILKQRSYYCKRVLNGFVKVSSEEFFKNELVTEKVQLPLNQEEVKPLFNREEVKPPSHQKEVKPPSYEEKVQPPPYQEEGKSSPFEEEVKPSPYQEEVKASPYQEEEEFYCCKDVDVTMICEERQPEATPLTLPLFVEPVITLPSYGLIASIMTATITSARANHELRHKNWSSNNESFICSNTGSQLSDCPWESTGTCGLEKLTEIKEL